MFSLFSLLVGLVNGVVYEYEVAEDMNSMTKKRQWSAHTSSITGLFISSAAKMVFSCSKDKSVVWHCIETGYKIGRPYILVLILRLFCARIPVYGHAI